MTNADIDALVEEGILKNFAETSQWKYTMFYNEYVKEHRKLCDIPSEIEVRLYEASAWAADIIGTVNTHVIEAHRENGKKLLHELSENFQKATGKSVFEYGKTCAADYMDGVNGVIYRFSIYNRNYRFFGEEYADSVGIPVLIEFPLYIEECIISNS